MAASDGDVDELDVDRRIVVAVGPSWAGPRGRWEERRTALPQSNRRAATCSVCRSMSRARSPSSAVLVSATNSRKRGCGLPRAHSLAGGPATRLICPTRRFRAGQPVLGPPVALVVVGSSCRAVSGSPPHAVVKGGLGATPGSFRAPPIIAQPPAISPAHAGRPRSTRSTPQVASAPRARTSPPSWSCTCSAGSGHR